MRAHVDSARSDEIRVRFACGCLAVLGSAERDPCCGVHQERRIVFVDAPPPRIRAVGCAASGPHVKDQYGD
jgi:hypothetical protein